MVWLTGGSLALATLMIMGLFLLVLYQGALTFWPKQLIRVKDRQERVYLGEIAREERYQMDRGILEQLPEEIQNKIQQAGGVAERILIRTGNYDLYGDDFRWVPLFEVRQTDYPQEAITLERLEWGPFYGFMEEFRVDGNPVAQ
ncbi:MAG: hypothetical protein L0Y56_17065, partial [Nitrospira sp.]|nr:hypothetical protein [Nitrospira sp.]